MIPVYVVDAFTSRPFSGNPAAVCLLTADISDDLKQKIAMEMNLSETAFVLPLSNPDQQPQPDQHGIDSFEHGSRFSLRWFTPTTEVPLCGHATLASAAILFFKHKNRKELEFITRQSGTLTAVLRDGRFVEMRLPLNPPTRSIDHEHNPEIWKLAMTAISGCGSVIHPAEVRLSPSTKKLLIVLEDKDRSILEHLKPDLTNMRNIDTGDSVRGVIISAADDKYDFVSRYFAPWVGIPEDPVTGSAHTVLAPFWKNRLGKNIFFARQCSVRGGELHLRIVEDSLFVSGEAAIVSQGMLDIGPHDDQ